MVRTPAASRRVTALALAAVMVLTACGGGGSDSADDGIDASDGSREAPEVEDAVVETTTSTTTTTTSTTTTSTTTTTTLAPAPAVSPELCDAIGTYYTTAQTTDFIAADDAFALEVTLFATASAVDEVLQVADGDPVAAPWVEARRLLDVINGLDAIDWDISRGNELPNQLEVSEALISLAEEIDATAPFLIAECDITPAQIAELDAAAEELAAEVASEAPAEADPIEVTDDTGRITMTVPGDWTDLVTTPQGNVSRLAAAPDFQAFDTSFAAEGGFVLTVDVAEPDVWRVALDDTAADLLPEGCVANGEVPYDDGLYTGAEISFDCGAPGFTLDLIGARDAAGSIAIIVQIVRPVGDTTARDLIVESFLIS